MQKIYLEMCGSWFWAIDSLIIGTVTFVVIPHSIGPSIPGLSLKQYDYINAVLDVTRLTLFVFAWTQAFAVGTEKPYTYALLIIGIIIIAAFAIFESCVTAPPLQSSLRRCKSCSSVAISISFG